MNTKLLSLIMAFFALLGFTAHAAVKINEIRIDQPGSDTDEYIEFWSDAVSESLAGLTLLVIGDGAGGSGTIESVYEFDTSAATGLDQLYLVAKDGDTLGATADDTTANFSFENGDNVTFLLVTGFTGANGDDIDDDNNGSPNAMLPWASIVDAVALIESDTTPPTGTEYEYATTLGFPTVGPNGDFVPGHAYSAPDGSSNWLVGLFSPDDIDALDSPGASNPSAAALTLTIDGSNSIAEDTGFIPAYAIVSTNAASGIVGVTVSTDDSSEAIGFDVSIDTSVSQMATIDIETVDDLFPDGTQTVTLTVSAAGHTSDSQTFDVTDNGDSYSLVINEVYYGDSVTGDANGDGSADDRDEFIEIVNVTGSPIDLTGFRLQEESLDQFSPDGIHAFREGTVLDPGCALVVFAGGIQDGIWDGSFGDAEVVNSSRGLESLFLSADGDDFVTIRNGFSEEVFTLPLPVPPNGTDSYNLTTDLTPGTYAAHSAVAGAAGPFSPGTAVDGTPFCTVTDFLTITSVSPSSVAEEAGFAASTVTVTLSAAAPAAGQYVTLVSDNTAKITVPSPSFFINSGGTVATFDLDTVDNGTADGTVMVELTAISSNYLNGTGMIEVTDPVDTGSANDIFISQYYEGTSNNKHLELYNNGAVTLSLGGWSVARFSNQNAEAWKTGGTGVAIDLSGNSIDPGQTFILSNGSADTPGYVIPDLTSSDFNGNGNDSYVLYNGGDIVDVISLIETPALGANTSFVRIAIGMGWDTSIGSNITDFPSIWEEFTLANVDTANSTANEYLGFFTLLVAPALELSVTPDTISEGDGVSASTGTVTRTDADNSSALLVTLSIDDTTAATVPATVTIPATFDSTVFSIDAVQDGDLDGDQVATIFASAPGFDNSAMTILTVTDDDSLPPSDLILNEYLADPFVSGSAFDSNGDGTGSSTEDEFVELVNTGATPFDISNWTLADGSSVRHTFPASTILDPGCAIVIFSGGTLGTGVTEVDPDGFSGAIVQIASSGSLSLNNSGDTITINDGAVDVISFAYGSPGDGESNTLSPDLAGTMTLHTVADTIDASRASPGTMIDGTAFCTPSGGDDFGTWIGMFPVGAEDGFTDDPNNNGIANGIENVIGGDPSADGGGSPLGVVSKAGPVFTFQHNLNKSVATDVTWAYEWSIDANVWTADGVDNGPTTVTFGTPSIEDGSDPVFDVVENTATATGTVPALLYVRIKATN